MNIKEYKKDEALVLAIEGRIDSVTSGTLEGKLLATLETGTKRLVLDFTAVDYISSAGLRVLLMAAKKMPGLEGKLALAALSANVREVFDIAGFTEIFTIADSPEEAVQLLSQGPDHG